MLSVDSNGIIHCPDCRKDVHVGKGGIRNYDTQHFGSSQCQKNRAKTGRVKKSTNGMQKIVSFFSMKPTARPVLSTVKAPSLINSKPSPSHNTGITPPTLTSAPASTRDPIAGCPYALRLLADLRYAALQLPQTVPEAQDDDVLAQFATKPLEKTATDAFEVLDPILNNALGWAATEEEMAKIVRRGAKGVEGLCQYMECFVVDYGVPGVLLEGKITTLLKAMAKL